MNLENLKGKLDEIQNRVDSMCRKACEENGLDYEKEFGEKTEQTDSDGTAEAADTADGSTEQPSDCGNDVSAKTEDTVETNNPPPEPAEEKESVKAANEEKKVSDEEKEKNKEYIDEFMKNLGYRDGYYPDNNSAKVADQMAREYALEMPTDTAAVEVEGDAVILLVGSDDKEAVKAGKKLGDILMGKSKGGPNHENRLKAMREAFLSLRSIASAEEVEINNATSESFGGTTLYSRAKTIFECANGLNESGSEYGFDDYVRESVLMSDKQCEISESDRYFGGESVANESADSFSDYVSDWIRNGRDPDALVEDPRDSYEVRNYKRMMRKLSNPNRIDRNRDGFISQKEYKKSLEDNTDMSGNISTEKLLKGGLRQVGTGINNYLNKFLPMSWITGVEKGIGKGAKVAFDKVGGDKISSAYKAMGGNKALGLGTLGTLAFGPVGGVLGALAGKGLQKLVNYGNS